MRVQQFALGAGVDQVVDLAGGDGGHRDAVAKQDAIADQGRHFVTRQQGAAGHEGRSSGRINGQARICASVAPAKVAPNQAATSGWKSLPKPMRDGRVCTRVTSTVRTLLGLPLRYLPINQKQAYAVTTGRAADTAAVFA